MYKINLSYRSKIIIGLSFLVLLICSCESWLSVSPESEVKYEDLFSTKNGFKDQLTGVYTSMSTEDLYGAHLTYGMMDALGQQYTWKAQAGNYYYLHRFEYNNSLSANIISGIWNHMYNSIANVNILLKALDEYGGVLSPEERDIYKGEALALRAFLHFDILRIFGKSYKAGKESISIPYVRSIQKKVTPSSTVSEVLDFIKQDLEAAKLLLQVDPIKTGESSTEFLGDRSFHLNYYAVCAELARICLYKNDLTEALKNAVSVIESGKYHWITRDKISTTSREERDGIFIPEGIFILNNTVLKELANKYLREGQSENQFEVLISLPEVIDEIFEASLYGGLDWRYVYFFENIAGTYKANTKLWQLDMMPVAYRNRQPLLKLSEMYLIAAECEPDRAKAVDYLNELRQNRGFSKDYDIASNITEEQLKSIIEKEYRKEFVGEGQWFFYCKRNDKDELPNVTVPFSKTYYVLPMPQQEKEYGNRNDK